MYGLDDDDSGDDGQRAVDGLGFMLRAPVAVIASVPIVLGVLIWPLMTQVIQFYLYAH
jgi:hypothetical protein